jgi:peptidoglycan hydrolase CwlO-like protein
MLKMPRTITKLLIFLLFGVYFLLIFNFPVYSNSVAELEEEIARKEQEIKEKESTLQGVERRIEEIGSSDYSVSQKIALITEEIRILESNIEETEAEIEKKVKGIEQKQAELEKTKVLIGEVSGDLYVQSRFKVANFFLGGGNWKSVVEGLYIRTNTVSMLRSEAEKIGGEFSSLAESKAGLDKEKEDLDKEKEGLSEAHKLLADEKAKLQAELSRQVADRGVIIKRIESLETQISHLLEEQKEAARREAALLSAPPPPQSSTPPEIPTGGFYISGRGRDLYQGHGVGMSQYGAYGAAEKGQSAEQILKFYYTNVRIEPREGNITVDGNTMDQNVYVAGLGEVPSKACGTAQQVADRPDKYTLRDPSNAWSCWPEEAIKAQVIAARTYGRFRGSLGSTASDQVYIGGNAKQWAADETKDLVIVSNGGTHANGIISAVYSSDNSQGSGTANNDTIWQNFVGVGTPHTYLRSVNDNSFAKPTQWTQWVYQTKGYTYDDVLRMLKSQTSSYSRINNANRIESIEFERDPSGRVARMLFYFDTSADPQPIGGWWFKNIWNIWQGGLGGTPDYIYSQTFYFLFE